jgi:hypothetical protein
MEGISICTVHPKNSWLTCHILSISYIYICPPPRVSWASHVAQTVVAGPQSRSSLYIGVCELGFHATSICALLQPAVQAPASKLFHRRVGSTGAHAPPPVTWLHRRVGSSTGDTDPSVRGLLHRRAGSSTGARRLH